MHSSCVSWQRRLTAAPAFPSQPCSQPAGLAFITSFTHGTKGALRCRFPLVSSIWNSSWSIAGSCWSFFPPLFFSYFAAGQSCAHSEWRVWIPNNFFSGRKWTMLHFILPPPANAIKICKKIYLFIFNCWGHTLKLFFFFLKINAHWNNSPPHFLFNIFDYLVFVFLPQIYLLGHHWWAAKSWQNSTMSYTRESVSTQNEISLLLFKM